MYNPYVVQFLSHLWSNILYLIDMRDTIVKKKTGSKNTIEV